MMHNTKNVMELAWRVRRSAAKRYQCGVSEISMGECLKQAWSFQVDFDPAIRVEGKPKKPGYDLPIVIAKKCANRYDRIQAINRQTGFYDGYGYTEGGR